MSQVVTSMTHALGPGLEAALRDLMSICVCVCVCVCVCQHDILYVYMALRVKVSSLIFCST